MGEYMLISDAAREVDVESHVLRYWEEELGLPIHRNEQGHRFYTEANLECFKQIKRMKEQGLQLKAIKLILKGEELNVVGVETATALQTEGEFARVQEVGEEKARRLQWLLRGMIQEVLQENNRELGRELRESVIKELDYQFRIQEEQEEEREKKRELRDEEYYRKIDELLCKKSREKSEEKREKKKRHFF